MTYRISDFVQQPGLVLGHQFLSVGSTCGTSHGPTHSWYFFAKKIDVLVIYYPSFFYCRRFFKLYLIVRLIKKTLKISIYFCYD
jgi:hypothetical protein